MEYTFLGILGWFGKAILFLICSAILLFLIFIVIALCIGFMNACWKDR